MIKFKSFKPSNPLFELNLSSDKVASRVGFGLGLLKAGQINTKVVGLSADLTESTQMHLFRDAFPSRFIEVGVAEQNLVTVGSGMASMGKVPFVSSYAAFAPGRCWEQIRTTICLNDQPVKIVGSHAGLSVGPDGATHQILEDIALMRSLPNMVVLSPGDANEAEMAALALAADPRPGYIRLSREATEGFTPKNKQFVIGDVLKLSEGSDITIISTGVITVEAIEAVIRLRKDNIKADLLHAPSLKPINKDTIIESAAKTGLVITVEEHQVSGGLGSLVSEILSENLPTLVHRIGIEDKFGQSGTYEELKLSYGLNSTNIVIKAKQLLRGRSKA
ncbi:MAG: transketolase C-terminal domain-containing protein [Candidatus Saccharimonadales bacterium]|jgi:transketolase